MIQWKNVRLIFLREVRDQLRDRRTLFMIAILPLLLYPAMGIGMVQLTLVFTEQPRTVVLLGTDELPQPQLLQGPHFAREWFVRPDEDATSAQDLASKIEVISDEKTAIPPLDTAHEAKDREPASSPRPGSVPDEHDPRNVALRRQKLLASATKMRAEMLLKQDKQRLLADHLAKLEQLLQARHNPAEATSSSAPKIDEAPGAETTRPGPSPSPAAGSVSAAALSGADLLKLSRDSQGEIAAAATSVLQLQGDLKHADDVISQMFASSEIQVLVVIPAGFKRSIEEINRQLAERSLTAESVPRYERPEVIYNKTDDKSLLTYNRVMTVLENWEQQILRSQLQLAQLPEAFPHPVRPTSTNIAVQDQRLASLWGKMFPALLVMMAATGAFYPAIDLCAGEKERGTMETLLICPATRTEIVLGKFLTVLAFSCTTALLNLVSMGFTGKHIVSMTQSPLMAASDGIPSLPPLGAMIWILVLLVPLSTLFSALCLAFATFARSSKEGQYYLTPLLMVTLGITVFCLSPGIELTPKTTFYAIVPVAGPALLLKSLLQSSSVSWEQLSFVFPVLISSLGYCVLALWWAIDQFQKEDVLFREAERFEPVLWLKHLLRDKEPTPNFSEGVFCFMLIMFLQFGFMNVMKQALLRTSPETRSMVTMQLLMIQQIAINCTPALLMGLLLTSNFRKTFKLFLPNWRYVPLAVGLAGALHVVSREIQVRLWWFFPQLPEGAESAFRGLSQAEAPYWLAVLVWALVPAVCEEVVFRGFILSGFSRSRRYALAVVLSSVAFGMFHMIPAQVFNASLLGLVLGTLAVRSGSLLPPMLFHIVYNTLGISGAYIARNFGEALRDGRLVSVEQNHLHYSFTFVMLCLQVAIVLLWLLWRMDRHTSESVSTEAGVNVVFRSTNDRPLRENAC